MSEYIRIICFVVGMVVASVLDYIFFKLGFRASFEIRQSKDYPEEEGKGLFKKPKEPAEFELLKEQDNADRRD